MQRRLCSVLLASAALPLIAAPALSQENSVVLEEITLRATYETEGTGSYTTDFISVGDKDTRPLREIPQSTTVLTRERLDDGNFTSLDTAMRRTSGVYVLANDDGRSSLYSRGFEFDSLYLNGLRTPLTSIYGTQPDMAAVDHVEILRGPSGLFSGAGEPAGAVNMRLKQPQDTAAGSASLTFGSWNSERVEADVTGPLNESGTVRGRIAGAFTDKESWVDTVDNSSGVLYGALAVDATPDTTATFSIYHHQRDITPFNGLPTLEDGTLLDLDRSTFTGAGWNDFDNEVTNYVAEVEHRLENGGHLKFSAMRSDVDADFLYGYAAGPASADGFVPGMRYLYRDYSEDSVSVDAHASLPFVMGNMETNLIVGVDWRRDKGDRYDNDARASVIRGDFDLRDWDSGVARPDAAFATNTRTKSEQTGLYAQWRVKPAERFTVIAGGRFSWYDAETTTTALATGASRPGNELSEDAEFTPYLGLVWDLDDRTSAYASYTEIFQPQDATDASGDLLKPRSGRQFELGMKSELMPGLNAQAALFQLEDRNRAVGDPDSPGNALAQGEARMRGLELEATGSIRDNWEVSAGYTYTDTTFTDTQTAAGAEFYTPEHMLQLWTKYRFTQPGWEKLSVGGGIRAMSGFKNISRTAAGGATTIEAGGYAVADVMASYAVNDRVSATLSVNNLFDKTYYERVGGTSVFNFYGEPRSVSLRIGAKF